MTPTVPNGTTITAVLAQAAATTNPTYLLDWEDNNTKLRQTNSGSLDGTTPVAMLTGASILRTVVSVTIYNADTAAVTVTVKMGSNAFTSPTLQPGESLLMDSSGCRVVDNNGQAKTTSNSTTASVAVDKRVVTAMTNTATVTSAQLLTKILAGVPTGAATYTLPTAALLVAAMAPAQVGYSFDFIISNESGGANTITVAAGTGGTGKGTLTVSQNVCRKFTVVLTNVTGGSEAYNVYGA